MISGKAIIITAHCRIFMTCGYKITSCMLQRDSHQIRPRAGDVIPVSSPDSSPCAMRYAGKRLAAGSNILGPYSGMLEYQSD